MALLDGALDPRLASVGLGDGEGYVHVQHLTIHLCLTALALDLAGESDVDAIRGPFDELAGLRGTGAHVHLLNASVFGTAVHEAERLGHGGSGERQQQHERRRHHGGSALRCAAEAVVAAAAAAAAAPEAALRALQELHINT